MAGHRPAAPSDKTIRFCLLVFSDMEPRTPRVVEERPPRVTCFAANNRLSYQVMRTRVHTAYWILVFALVSQGAVPGLVVCIEPSGQVGYETVDDECCSGDNQPSRAAPVVLVASAKSETTDSCGPCTDTPVRSLLVTRPDGNGDVGTSPCVGTIPAFVAATARTCSGSHPIDTAVSLGSVKTTALLI